MTAALDTHDQKLLAATAGVDVMDVAGRIVANPRRATVSTADQLAMAIALEQLQAIAIEADLLVHALDLPDSGRPEAEALKDHAVQTQTQRVRQLVAAARGETNTPQQETNDGAC